MKMNDYISRDDVLKAIDYQHEVNNVFESEAAYVHMWETINDDMGIKSADVQPVKHGHWIKENREVGGYFKLYQSYIHCSECGNEHYYGTGTMPKYCDECGTRMDGDAE